jgi:hypothetical protein
MWASSARTFHALGKPSDTPWHMQQVSGITRKRLATRAVERLENSRSETARLGEDLTVLQQQDGALQARIEEYHREEESQNEALSKCRHQNMMLHDRIRELESVIQEHEQAAEVMVAKVPESPCRVDCKSSRGRPDACWARDVAHACCSVLAWQHPANHATGPDCTQRSPQPCPSCRRKRTRRTSTRCRPLSMR